MLYGVTFKKGTVSKHTLNDFGLYQVGAAYVAPPEIQSEKVVVPGMDGALDFTEALDGHVHYGMREFRARYRCIEPRDKWASIYSKLMNFLHGVSLQAVLDDDIGFYYIGRFEVNAPDFEHGKWDVEIKGECDPWKYYQTAVNQPYLWDPFNFETDYAYDFSAIEINGTGTLKFEQIGGKAVVPRWKATIASGNTLKITRWNGKTVNYSLVNGETVYFPASTTQQGTNTIVFTGTGTVNMDYREMSL